MVKIPHRHPVVVAVVCYDNRPIALVEYANAVMANYGTKVPPPGLGQQLVRSSVTGNHNRESLASRHSSHIAPRLTMLPFAPVTILLLLVRTSCGQ